MFLFNHEKHEGHENEYIFRVIRVFRGLKFTQVACSSIPFSLRHHRL